jgi:putative membrane protein
MGFITVLKFYSSNSEWGGILLYLMTFIYGAIWWLIVAGLITSVGIIIDVYINEREGLAKVIVSPFFISAVGLILYGASVYILSINGVPEFPLNPSSAWSYILYSTIIGLACAIAGVIIQYFIKKRLAEQRRQAIIEVI